jgi:hypothetical protein
LVFAGVEENDWQRGSAPAHYPKVKAVRRIRFYCMRRWNYWSKWALESAHFIGKMCTSEFPYGRGERINTKESAYR